MYELKIARPCPFCGSMDLLLFENKKEAYIRCIGCGTEHRSGTKNGIEAVDAWNTRYNEKTERLDFDEGTWQKFGEFEICNCCGFTRKVPRENDDGQRIIKSEYKFCPWCGKKMKEEVRRCLK